MEEWGEVMRPGKQTEMRRFAWGDELYFEG